MFGAFDGCSSLLGVIVYLLLTHPGYIFPAALSGAISAALSMAAGSWLSDDNDRSPAALVMGAATLSGALLPAVPFAFATSPVATMIAAVICVWIGIIVAIMRPHRGLGLALAETFGLLIVILLVTVGCAAVFPEGGAG